MYLCWEFLNSEQFWLPGAKIPERERLYSKIKKKKKTLRFGRIALKPAKAWGSVPWGQRWQTGPAVSRAVPALLWLLCVRSIPEPKHSQLSLCYAEKEGGNIEKAEQECLGIFSARSRRYAVVYKYFVWEIITAEGFEFKEAHQSLFARSTGRTPRIWIRAFLTFWSEGALK